MSFNDQNGVPIFTASAGSTPSAIPGGQEASPVLSQPPSAARAAPSSSQGDRPWKVVRIDSERSEIRDAHGEPIRVSGDHETMHYIVDIVNEGGR